MATEQALVSPEPANKSVVKVSVLTLAAGIAGLLLSDRLHFFASGYLVGFDYWVFPNSGVLFAWDPPAKSGSKGAQIDGDWVDPVPDRN